MRRLAILLACGLSLFVRADPKCLLGFANAAATEADAPVLVWATYRDLLEQVAGNRLKESHVEQLLAADDPFSLAYPSDLEGFNRRLAEFKKLVEAKGWNTEAVRSSLKSNLRDWNSQRRHAASRTAKSVRWAQNVRLPIEPGQTASVTPDGRWIVSASPPKYLSIYDVEAGTKREQRLDLKQPIAGLALSPDGTELFMVPTSGKDAAKIESAVLHPNGREALVLYRPVESMNGQAQPDRIAWLDLETKKAIGTYVFPNGDQRQVDQILADGRVIVRTPSLGQADLVDVKGRMELTP